MRLKKIEVVGFKSFADRQVIHVDEQITGVIGPNGCGKSNIVDAVRWAMGEQSAKHLRGGGMADVIFAGCATRGPAGMAEVTLTFENQGEVPVAYLDYPEIAVTRRLYGDGTSEYLINKVPSRLRDITELLLGTGAGTKGYSIIEQGQVGKLVSSKPEERRHVIDEAAGITRFKGQKAAAERKMAATRQNLMRVQDVIGELESRLGTLRRQAQKAERYKQYREELRDLDLWMASHKYLELMGTGRVLEERRADLSQQVEDLVAALSARDGEMEAKRSRLSELERTLSERQEAVYGLDNRIRLLESENQYRERERENLRQSAASARAEREMVERSIGSLQAELRQVEAQQAALGGEQDEGNERAAVERAEADHRRAAERLASLEQELVGLRSEYGDLQTSLASNESRLQSGGDAVTELQGRVAGFERELAEVSEELQRSSEALAQARQALGQATEALETLRRGRQQLDGQRLTLKEQVQGAEVELDTMRGELHRCKSRLQSLEEIQGRYRRCASGVQVVMEHQSELRQMQMGEGGETGEAASADSASTAVLGIMADYIAAPQHLESAVSAMLGDRLEGVVVDHPPAGVRGVELLKELQEGRTTFLPQAVVGGRKQAEASPVWRPPGQSESGGIEVVDLSARRSASPPAESPPTEPLQGPGVVGRLVELIDIDRKMAPLAEILVGDAVVVDSLSRALELWQQGQRQQTLVTLDGDRIEPSGVVVGGASDALDSALLQQKREIRELQEISRELSEGFEDARKRHLALAERLAQVEAEREHNEGEVLAAEKRRLELAGRVEHGEARLAELQQRQTEAQGQQTELQQQLANRQEDIAEVERALAEQRERVASVGRRIEHAEQQRSHWEQERDRLAAVLTDAKVDFARWQQQSDSLAEAHQRLRKQVDGELERLRRLDETSEQAELKGREIDQALAEAKEEREQLVVRSREATSLVHDAREQYEALRVELDQAELSIRNLRAELDEERERLKEVEMGVQQIELERRHLDEDVGERFDLQLPEILVDFHDRPLAGRTEQGRHKELKRVISRMGEVNLTAIDEYDEVTSRYEYLTEQRDDLENAIAQLQEAIDRINRTTRERFKETFAQVNERFQQVFPRLFAGGRAELRLTDADDLLSTGVEIVAQPPGKQLRSLDLLSGGEKALTATSLVFAIFLIKPSPFCILDEVDAPLDDANVGRFCQLVRELSQNTQFVIITHNKVTMENADRLYGVTMEQRGVSKLVSVNLRRAVELAYN